VSGLVVASAGNVLVWMVWVVAAFACVGSGIAVVTFSNPFFSALALIGNLGSLAIMYLLLSAEFVAAAQVLVYAGAVVVIVVAVGMQASGSLSHETAVGPSFGTPAWIGRVFLTDHLLAFEITSVVLLIAAVGGVILGSHTKRAV
jgi:NADH:ubiquinone oxidoreductase subunit 6 (subunit J)